METKENQIRTILLLKINSKLIIKKIKLNLKV